MRLNRYLTRPVFAPEGVDSAAPSDATIAPPTADTASILYPDDTGKPAADPVAVASAPAGDWKEYEPDAGKSDADNAAAKAEHDKTKPAAADAADVVPADGKYALTMPEGVEVDQALLEAVSPRFKELGLTGKQAQALTDDFIKAQQDRAIKQGETWAATTAGWVDAAKADPEMGGAKWDSTVRAASGVVNQLGTPALKEYLNASGGGNHPEMIRFMAKVGALIGEDKPAISEQPGAKVARDAAAILYPDDKPKGK